MTTQQQFTALLDSVDGVARVVLDGDLDLASVHIFEDSMFLAEEDEAIVLDLSGLTFLDTTALHAFVGAHALAEARGQRITIVGATDGARRLFQLTETDYLLRGVEETPGRSPFTLLPADPTGPRMPAY